MHRVRRLKWILSSVAVALDPTSFHPQSSQIIGDQKPNRDPSNLRSSEKSVDQDQKVIAGG
jgi:hypothetical protein